MEPIFLQDTLSAQKYRTEPLINEWDDDRTQHAYFRLDGAPCHCTAESLDYLTEF